VNGRAAVYRLYDAGGALLYIGATSEPGRRFSQHKGTKPWWSDVARHTIEWHETEQDALTAEAGAILAEHPLHNGHPGRPPVGPQRNVRWPDERWEPVARAARKVGMSASEFIRQAAEEKAEQVERLEDGGA
jgi:GIY-YIG catalytic domain